MEKTLHNYFYVNFKNLLYTTGYVYSDFVTAAAQ